MATLEALVSKVNGWEKSGGINTGVVVTVVLNLTKASVAVEIQ